jgi:hypothetical protein
MKTYRIAEVQLHTFLSPAIYGGEWSASLPVRFTPDIKTRQYTMKRNFIYEYIRNFVSVSLLALKYDQAIRLCKNHSMIT